jgi:hypothetical protein
VTAVGAALLSSVAPASAATGWTVASAPPQSASLSSVTAVPGSADAWAVGNLGGTFQPLIDSWNGSSWTQPTIPGVSGVGWLEGVDASSALTGVADISPTDAYAIGYSNNTNAGYVFNWNGTAWSQVAIPQPATGGTIPAGSTSLSAISADGPDNVWVVGSYLVPGTFQRAPYSLRFNGTAWSIVKLATVSGASASTGYTFGSAVANSPTDVWAVGETSLTTVKGASASTLIEHGNGTAWSVVPSPSPGSGAVLTGVTTSNAANDVWAVGSYTPTGASQPQNLILNWNGTTWSIVTRPNSGADDGLADVAASTGTGASIWAVGYSLSGGVVSPLILQGS